MSRPSRAYSAIIDSSFANAIRASTLDRNHGSVLPLSSHLQAGAAAFANDILVLSLTVWVWMGATGHVQGPITRGKEARMERRRYSSFVVGYQDEKRLSIVELCSTTFLTRLRCWMAHPCADVWTVWFCCVRASFQGET